jgi:hypothetical protein
LLSHARRDVQIFLAYAAAHPCVADVAHAATRPFKLAASQPAHPADH